MEAQSAARADILGVHRDGHRGGRNVGDGLHMGRGLTNVCLYTRQLEVGASAAAPSYANFATPLRDAERKTMRLKSWRRVVLVKIGLVLVVGLSV